MELRQFVKTAITDIMGAVSDAQSECTSGKVSPILGMSNPCIQTGVSTFQAIEFEVAVSDSQSSEGRGKLNVVAALLSIGASGSRTSENFASAIIKFRVPVQFHGVPADQAKWEA